MKNEENNVFEYLDKLRESGITNMFGAVPFIQEEFGFDYETSKAHLLKWMKTFAERHNK